ncbi:hypothetical protein Clacol_002938 [Clathrus columnatus]|uniref:Mitochondrial import inner membrane translocase subunit n=1 Tax=Clathrus columnatus TaxID=1419009 RepID=A0AAV5A651_9AGAM|nr:hypothetical protein Clacol_002938 [Clathrus columnatus]
MSSFLSSPPSGTDSESIKQRLMSQMKQELAMVNAQELLNQMTKKCYSRCITKPSAKPFSSSDETCLTRCMQRYMEAFDVISRSYTSRLQRERAAENAEKAFS